MKGHFLVWGNKDFIESYFDGDNHKKGRKMIFVSMNPFDVSTPSTVGSGRQH